MLIILLFITPIWSQLSINVTSPTGSPTQLIKIETYQILELTFNLETFKKQVPSGYEGHLLDLLIDGSVVRSFQSSLKIKIISRKRTEMAVSFNITRALYLLVADSPPLLKKLIDSCALIQSSFVVRQPSRSVLGLPNMHPIIYSQALLADYLLPFNMPTKFYYNIELDSEEFNDFKKHDQEFWQEYSDEEISLLSVPWLPFFGNCDNHGQYLYFYDLIENSQNCSYVDRENTRVVEVIPTTGLDAIGDQCNLLLQCRYLESLNESYDGNLWWQAENDNLFYIGKKSLDSHFLFENSNDGVNASDKFQQQIDYQDDTFIPVQFTTLGVLRSSMPSHFAFEVLYNQVSQTEKEIVSAKVTASNYVPTKDYSGAYTLQIIYRPMDYLELINSFQFDIVIYLVLYIFIGILTVLGVMSLWLLNKTLSLIENPPKLRIYQTFLVAFLPAITGCFRATVPIILFVLLLDLISGANGLFGGIFFKYDVEPISTEQAISYEKGRSGLLLLIAGVFLIKIGAKLVIPFPSDEDITLIRANHEKMSQEKNYEFSEQEDEQHRDSTLKQQDEIRETQQKISSMENQSHTVSRQGTIISRAPGSAPPIPTLTLPPKKSTFRKASIFKALNNSIRDNLSQKDISPIQRRESQFEKKDSIGSIKKEPIQEEEQDIIEYFMDVLTSKDYHYQVICLFTSVLILFLLGFSYMQLFYKNIFYFLIVLQFVDALFYWILSEYLLEEQMLIEPLMACLEVTQFVMFMAAESFQEFVFSYLVRLSLIILFRTYINPILKNIPQIVQKVKKWLSANYPQYQFFETDQQQDTKDKHIQFYLGNHIEGGFSEDQSVEQVIQMTLSFSSKIHATFIKPLMLVLIKIFEKETQIPSQYFIGFREFDYYIYFAFVFIVPQILIDIYVLNSLELIYGYKIFDYYDYCKYRNEFRQQKLFEHSLSLDRSINRQYRSADNLKFTDQFYYNGSIIIYSILLIILGVTIIIRNHYIVYEDPVMFLMIMFLYFIMSLSKWIIVQLWEKFDFWKLKEKKQKVNLDSLSEFLNPAKENLESIIEVEAIKKQFINVNKEWLVSNLGLFLTAEQFVQQDEFLLQSYQQLVNEERKVQKETIRNQQIIKKQKELELKSRKKPRKMTEQSLTHISHKDSEEVQPQTQQTIIIKKSKIEPFRAILSIWYYRAKQNTFLKYLVSEVISEHQAEHCKRCGLDIDLRVVELVPFEKMTNQFKFRIIGTPFNKFEWIRFYEAHQKFVTLCIDCENAYKSRLLQRQHQTVNDAIKMTQKAGLAKAIIYKWLFMARSNLLHNHQTKR